MSAEIIIAGGRNAGKSFWIERQVLRLGSGADCHIQLAEEGLPSTAATIQFRDGQYHVYNRSETPLIVGDVQISAGANAPWRPGTVLFLTPALSVRLQVTGDPRPSPKPIAEVKQYGQIRDEQIREEEQQKVQQQAEDKAKGGGSKAGQNILAGLIFVVAVVAALFLFMPKSSNEPTVKQGVTLLNEGLKKKGKEIPAQAVEWLQSAESARLRGHNEVAVRRFEKIRQELLDPTNPVRKAMPEEYYKSFMNYVNRSIVDLKKLIKEASA